MVLDHARDFFTSAPFGATDPDKTYAALFFTRWVTHFCAPTFMLLAGTGVGISRARGRSQAALARFLLSRGLWLVVLELTWVRFGWLFDLRYHFAAAQVIWALGWCMVILAGVVFLPRGIVVTFGAALVLGHNAFDAIKPEQFGDAAFVWRILHAGGALHVASDRTLYIAYPLVPWVAVMALGYAVGQKWSDFDRRSLIGLGMVLVVSFVALRWSGIYGDPRPFVPRGGIRSLFAFLDCAKYPPSLDYLLMTLGPITILLGILRGRHLRDGFSTMLVTFGRVPLFFYLLHIPLVHALSLPFRASRGLNLFHGPFDHGLAMSLPTAYAMSLLAIAILWWPCRRWAALKSAHPHGWLSYL